MFWPFGFLNVIFLILQNENVFLLGAVLIFLPGYDEIVSLREKIYDDKTFADNTR